MKKLIITLIIVIIIFSGFYLYLDSSSNVTGNTALDNSEKVKTFIVTGDHLRFFIDGIENPEMRIKQGDKVRIEFTSTEGFHDLVLDEFNTATQKVNAGGSSSIEFVADKKGIFEYYCSVGQHRKNGMRGIFIVE